MGTGQVMVPVVPSTVTSVIALARASPEVLPVFSTTALKVTLTVSSDSLKQKKMTLQAIAQ